MTMVNYTDFMNDVAQEVVLTNNLHTEFIGAARELSDAIQGQLVKNNATFQNSLGKLHTTAAYVKNHTLDMPLNFEIFLPVRLPLPVTCCFDKKARTVQVTRGRTQHPFFFGNAVNFKSMNILLEQELHEVVKELPSCIASGVRYDLSYSVHRRGNVPFLHQLVATEMGSDSDCCIRFDFVLALAFDGAEEPLPPYYNAPIVSQWLAYGLVGEERSATDWSVLLPKWKTATVDVCLRSLCSLVLLYRLLKVQKCDLYAEPSALKLAFAMITEERGEGYKWMTIANMTTTALYYKVCRNLYQASLEQTRRDPLKRSSKMLSIRKQQLRVRGIYNILVVSAYNNQIGNAFVFAFFTYFKIPPLPSWSQWSPVGEVESKPTFDFPLEEDFYAPSAKRFKTE